MFLYFGFYTDGGCAPKATAEVPPLSRRRPLKCGRCAEGAGPAALRHRGQRDQVSVRAAWVDTRRWKRAGSEEAPRRGLQGWALRGPGGRSSALERRGPPCACARAPRAVEGPLCRCEDAASGRAARPAAGSSWQSLPLSTTLLTLASLSSCSRKECGRPKPPSCSARSSPVACKWHVGADSRRVHGGCTAGWATWTHSHARRGPRAYLEVS